MNSLINNLFAVQNWGNTAAVIPIMWRAQPSFSRTELIKRDLSERSKQMHLPWLFPKIVRCRLWYDFEEPVLSTTCLPILWHCCHAVCRHLRNDHGQDMNCAHRPHSRYASLHFQPNSIVNRISLFDIDQLLQDLMEALINCAKRKL